MERPIVLVEDGYAGYAVSDFRAFTDAGFDIELCSGSGPCPVLDGGTCRLVDAADVVLFARDGTARRQRLLERLAGAYPSTPILTFALGGDATDEAPEGCRRLPWPMSVRGQVDAVRRAAADG